jgi:Protein of unknown function (DUF1565)
MTLHSICVRAFVLLVTCRVLSATTYFVDPAGNDANAGSATAPFRTVAAGVSAAGPGDTVILNDGTYGNEGHISDGTGGSNGYASPVSITTSGTDSAWITVKAAHPGQAILDCGTTSGSLGCDKYIVLYSGARYWNFQDVVFTRGAFGGIGTDSGASYVNVLNCQFYNIGNWFDSTTIGEAGIGFDVTATNWFIDGNVFHDIGRTGGQSYLDLDHGIYAKGSNVVISNNIFYTISKGWAIVVANGATNWVIANNTFAFPSAGNGQIMLWETITAISIENNIFYNPLSHGVERNGRPRRLRNGPQRDRRGSKACERHELTLQLPGTTGRCRHQRRNISFAGSIRFCLGQTTAFFQHRHRSL